MSDDITFYDEIEAYCGRLSCRPGEPMPLHVSSRCDSFDLVVERWGAERVEVWRQTEVAVGYSPPPPEADAWGCGWPVTLDVPVGDDWESGFYLVSLTADTAASGRDVAHACFVVRPASRTDDRAKALLVLATNTWNAYNTWGGVSLYTGGHQVSFRRPWARGLLCRPEVERDDRKARPVRFGEDADADGEIFQRYRMANGYTSAIGSTGWFSHERRFVEWAEAAGYRLDYAVSTDLLAGSDALAGYDVVLGVGHDEYWTAEARDLVDDHVAGGGNYVSISGNTMFWQVRLIGGGGTEVGARGAGGPGGGVEVVVAGDGDGGPGTEGDAVPVAGRGSQTGADHMVCYKYAAHLDDPAVADDPTSMSGLWCDPLVGRPEWATLGAGSVFGLYHRFGQATPYGSGGFSIFRPEHWLLAGTGLGYGDVLGRDHGVVGYETLGCPIMLDEFQRPVVRPVAAMPADSVIIGLTLSSSLGVGEYPKSIAAVSDQGDLEFLADRFYGGATDENLLRVRNGNAVMLVCRPKGPDGGEVVTLGTTDWVFGLADDHRVAQVTSNILDRFLAGSPTA